MQLTGAPVYRLSMIAEAYATKGTFTPLCKGFTVHLSGLFWYLHYHFVPHGDSAVLQKRDKKKKGTQLWHWILCSSVVVYIYIFADLIYVHGNNLDVHDVLCVTNPQLRWFNECQAFRQPLFTVLPLTPQDCVLRRFRLRLRLCPIKTPGPHRPIGTCRIESRRSSTATRSLETSLCSTCRRPRR